MTTKCLISFTGLYVAKTLNVWSKQQTKQAVFIDHLAV